MRSSGFKALMLALLVLGSASASFGQPRDPYGRPYYGRWYRNTATVPTGTTMMVRLDQEIDTDDNRTGERWTGTVSRNVIVDGRVMIPAGAEVEGVVSNSLQGTHNTPASLDLTVQAVSINGRVRDVNAETETIVAGSKRAKKIGAIAIGAAAGALLGGGLTGSKRGGLIGGLLGGAAGYGVTRNAFRTLKLKEGTVVNFTTTQDMLAIRR